MNDGELLYKEISDRFDRKQRRWRYVWMVLVMTAIFIPLTIWFYWALVTRLCAL